MTYCPRCGIILSEGSLRCALCGSPGVAEMPRSAEAGGCAYPETVSPWRSADSPELSPEVLSSAERRRIAVELLSVAFGIAFAVTALADLFANRSFTWSRYSSVGILAGWLVSALPLILYGHSWILFGALAPAFVLLVFLLDAMDGSLRWFLQYGLPLVFCFEGTAAAIIALVGAEKRKGLNVIAVFLCGIAFICFGIETTIDLNRIRILSYDWSAVVALALVPTAGILFYLHYRIMNRASLKKLFRL